MISDGTAAAGRITRAEIPVRTILERPDPPTDLKVGGIEPRIAARVAKELATALSMILAGAWPAFGLRP
jgi:hypothetical protein